MFTVCINCPSTGHIAEFGGLRVSAVDEINLLADEVIRAECAACGALHDCTKDEMFVVIDGAIHSPKRPTVN